MLLKIVAPIIFIFGLVGNAINLYVFTRPPLRGLSTFRFLVYLSLIDFLFILIGIPHIISITYADFDFRDYSNVLCSLHTFFTIFLSHLSSNVLAVVGVFRCVTINTMKPMGGKSQTHLNLRKHNKQTAQPPAVNKRRRHTGPNNNDDNIRVVKSSNARISSKFFIISFFSEFGSADLITMSTCAILFLFDFHFLIWMRLAEHTNEPLLDNASNHSSNISEIASLAHWNSSSLHKINTNISSYSLASPSSKLELEAHRVEATRTIRCYPLPSDNYYFFYTKIWVWIDLFLYSYIPFVVMLICTILIIFRLVNINKNLISHSKSKRGPSSVMIKTMDMNKRSSDSENSQPKVQSLNRTASETRSLIEIKVENNVDLSQRYEMADMKASHHSQLSDTSLKATSIRLKVGANDSSNANLATNNLTDKNNKRRTKKNNQIYKLLLTLNIFFFVLVSPLVTANTLGYLNQDNELIGQICYMLAYLNHCLNFVFYGMSCGVYRQILIEKFTRIFSRSYCEPATKPAQTPELRAV